MIFSIPKVPRRGQADRKSAMRLAFAALLGTLAMSATHAQQYGEQDRSARNDNHSHRGSNNSHRQDASDNNYPMIVPITKTKINAKRPAGTRATKSARIAGTRSNIGIRTAIPARYMHRHRRTIGHNSRPACACFVLSV